MSRKNGRQQSAGGGGGGGVPVGLLLALLFFGVLGTTPLILKALNLHIQPVAAKTGYGVTLLPAPKNPAPVDLPSVARPIDPNLPPARLPTVDPSSEAALVSAEDARIRILLHNAVRIFQPEVLPTRGSLPTLVLTAGSHPYTATDLAQYGALVMLKHRAALLIDNVFVSTNAKLILGSSRLRVLYMDNTSGGFASIVSWGGNMTFQGTPAQPLTIMGWDRVAKAPAVALSNGRSYIRDVGGKMTFIDARVSSLGFWSGRTGGVAWTGVNGQPSTGSAIDSTFTDDTYGGFVARGQNLKFTDDLFEFNQLDGLHIHRYSVGTSVLSSTASRNGGNGFLIDRATQSTMLRDDLSQNNEGNGYFIDGRPLVNGASASGSAVAPGSGATVEDSAALYNERTGILVEGGTGTVLRADQVCAKITGIATRYRATNTVITGNDVRCGPRSGMSIGPAAPGAIVSGNTISGARIAMLVRSSGRIEVDNNLITGATVFGITARGLSSQVKGVGNVISGTGFRAVDARADAHLPSLSGTNLTGWLHHVKITFWSYLLFHPLAALWLSLLVLVVGCYLWSRRRRLPPHPYPASTRWRPGIDGQPLADPVPLRPEPVLVGAMAAGAGFAEAGVGHGRPGVGQPLTVVAERLDAMPLPVPAMAVPVGPVPMTPVPVASAAAPVPVAQVPVMQVPVPQVPVAQSPVPQVPVAQSPVAPVAASAAPASVPASGRTATWVPAAEIRAASGAASDMRSARPGPSAPARPAPSVPARPAAPARSAQAASAQAAPAQAASGQAASAAHGSPSGRAPAWAPASEIPSSGAPHSGRRTSGRLRPDAPAPSAAGVPAADLPALGEPGHGTPGYGTPGYSASRPSYGAPGHGVPASGADSGAPAAGRRAAGRPEPEIAPAGAPAPTVPASAASLAAALRDQTEFGVADPGAPEWERARVRSPVGSAWDKLPPVRSQESPAPRQESPAPRRESPAPRQEPPAPRQDPPATEPGWDPMPRSVTARHRAPASDPYEPGLPARMVPPWNLTASPPAGASDSGSFGANGNSDRSESSGTGGATSARGPAGGRGSSRGHSSPGHSSPGGRDYPGHGSAASNGSPGGNGSQGARGSSAHDVTVPASNPRVNGTWAAAADDATDATKPLPQVVD